MNARSLLFALPLSLVGCASSTSSPMAPAGSTVVDLNAPLSTPPPAPPPVSPPVPAAEPPATSPEPPATAEPEADTPSAAQPTAGRPPSAGVAGRLQPSAGGRTAPPSAPWRYDDPLGQEPSGLKGNLWGNTLDGSLGGLGLAGIGGSGQADPLGSGAKRGKGPQVRMGATSVNGRLPPEVIRRIVRQNLGRFRLCYEAALRKSPQAEGRIAVRFVINEEGNAGSVSDASSEGLDATAVACVLRTFHGLSFPKPEGGTVTVVYPILFSPGEGAPASSGASMPPPKAPAKP